MAGFLDDINEWMGLAQTDLITEYDRQGLRASGRFADELESDIKKNGTRYIVRMMGARHSEFMENGRRPNRTKSPEEAKKLYPAILQWIQDKNLNFSNGHAFAICLKIVYEGITVPNKFNPGGVVSNVVTRNRIDLLLQKIGFTLQDQIKSDTIRRFKNGQ